MTYKSVFDHSGQELSLKECLGGQSGIFSRF